MKDLKAFAPDNEELLKEMTLLLTLNNIRYKSMVYMFLLLLLLLLLLFTFHRRSMLSLLQED
jgi:hypothetical protein